MNSYRHPLQVVALLVALAAPVLGESQARLHGMVRDEGGAALPEVTISVTLPDVPSFRLETRTDRKGRYAITLNDASRTYLYRLSREGFQTLEANIKVPIGQNKEFDFEMLSLAEAEKRAAAGGLKRELTPQEKAVLAFNAGAEAAQRHDAAGARAKLEEAVALDPGLGAAWSALAGLAMAEQQFARAAEMAERAVAIAPGDARAQMIRFEAYQAAGDTEKARLAGEALAAADPAVAAAEFFNQGVELYNAGKAKEALPHFERAVAARPDLAKARYLLGLCYVNAGENAKAKVELEAFLALAPEDADAGAAREMLTFLK